MQQLMAPAAVGNKRGGWYMVQRAPPQLQGAGAGRAGAPGPWIKWC